MDKILNWRNNKIQFHFGDIGISIIWGYGSYTENYNGVLTPTPLQQKKENEYCDNRFAESTTVEIYPLGEWSEELKNRVLKHFNTDYFPVGYVPVEEIPYLLNILKRESKK